MTYDIKTKINNKYKLLTFSIFILCLYYVNKYIIITLKTLRIYYFIIKKSTVIVELS